MLSIICGPPSFRFSPWKTAHYLLSTPVGRVNNLSEKGREVLSFYPQSLWYRRIIRALQLACSCRLSSSEYDKFSPVFFFFPASFRLSPSDHCTLPVTSLPLLNAASSKTGEPFLFFGPRFLGQLRFLSSSTLSVFRRRHQLRASKMIETVSR